ncbi:MAG TPA: chitobiase/beta-hexosaminidase C-terminal domain-containing protein [Terracidiphilus sp.]|jgi:N-acetylneuraminic acid mutarotase|nr:chitobiase/beta-hexosaminidase C-terminal domain-containing protein [Terracidiphilus sp.]
MLLRSFPGFSRVVPAIPASASRRAATPFVSPLAPLGMMLLLAGLCLPAHAQTGEWAWMSGSSTTICNPFILICGQAGVYGTLGTPAPGNIPGGRYSATSWIDSSGNLWLFGGEGHDDDPSNSRQDIGEYGHLNDFWEFNPSTNEWTWMGGSPTVNSRGVYGTLGTPAPGNIPEARSSALGWIDKSGNLWLFSGAPAENDLWEFNPSTNEWAWMGGSITDPVGVYGTLGTPAPGNIPGGRLGAASWTDKSGNFWLFGGIVVLDASGSESTLNDLWEFSPSANEWTWMGGSNSASQQGGVYGTLGTPAAGNIPGQRSGASSWIDANGNFWLFGGEGDGQDANDVGALNDLWEFNPSTNEWAWMGGSNSVNHEGVYGTLGTPDPGNIPGARSGVSSWSDGSGNVWLFGGSGYDASGNQGYLNDLWEFNPSTNEWTWMGGSSTIPPTNSGYGSPQPGVYGTLGMPDAGNIPGGRGSATAWTDSSGNFWLFGGLSSDPVDGDQVIPNDLWEFLPSLTAPPAPTPTFSVPSGAYTSPQTVSISDTALGADIYFTVDGSTPTSLSMKYAGTALTISQNTTINAIAFAYGYTKSAVASATYTLPTAVTPVFTPPAGAYTSTQSVQISSTTPGAAIYYTLDGSTPTTGSAMYSTALTVINPSTVIKAIAVTYGYNNSTVATALYTIRPAPPSFSLPSGEYLTPQSVTISAAAGAKIYYTTDGSGPTTNSTPYAGPIAINQNMTIRATAALSGYPDSPYTGAEYAIKTPVPTFSLASGEYLTPQSLTISAAGAQIYYTTDGSSPSASSTPYTGAIAINKNVKIRATAVIPGYANSQYAGAAYGIKVPAPTFSLSSGIYPGPQQVSISDSMAGAAIYYTTDGTTPTSSSTPYAGSITVSGKEKIIAIASATGYANSPLVAAAYGIK